MRRKSVKIKKKESAVFTGKKLLRLSAGRLGKLLPAHVVQRLRQTLEGPGKWIDDRCHVRERIRLEVLAVSKLFRKKIEKFLVINFDPTMMEILQVESLPDGLKVLAYDIQKIPPSEEGKKEEMLVSFISDFIRGNGICDTDVLISISDSDSVFVKDFLLPVMPEEEVLKAAKWQLKDDVFFDLEKASLDWRVVEEFVNETGEKGVRTIFIAANSEVIHRYLSIVQKCRLDPLSITNGAFNYAHILEKLPGNPPVVAILDVGHTESTFGIYTNNKLNFVRRLPISWEKLMQSLTKVLVSDKGVTQFTYEEAEEITRTVGICQDGAELVKGNIHASHVMSLMRPLLEALLREIKFSLDYFTMNFEKERPTVLYITGDSSGLKNLDRYLNKEFQMDVSYLTLPACVDVKALKKKKFDVEDQNKIINAIGAALKGSQSIDLLPFEIKTQKLELVEKVLLRFLTVITGTAFVFSLFGMQFQIHSYQNRIRNATVHLQTMEDVKALAKRVREREDLGNKIEGGRVPMEGVLKAISILIPPEITLDTLEFNPGQYSLLLSGTASATSTAESALSSFMGGIEESIFFKEAIFLSSQRTGSTYKFEIKCDVSH